MRFSGPIAYPHSRAQEILWLGFRLRCESQTHRSRQDASCSKGETKVSIRQQQVAALVRSAFPRPWHEPGVSQRQSCVVLAEKVSQPRIKPITEINLVPEASLGMARFESLRGRVN